MSEILSETRQAQIDRNSIVRITYLPCTLNSMNFTELAYIF